MQDFRIAVADDALADLDRRLSTAILPTPTPGVDWSRGLPPAVLGELVARWRDGFDWRAHERRLNGYEQRLVEVDGCTIHALIVRGGRPGSLPVVVTHGWPYSFVSMLALAERLRGDVDVVIPSLPGFGYSDVLPEPFTGSAVAARWHGLMEALGYRRYLTYGEDVGAEVSDWLAATRPDAVAGIVASHASFSARERPGVELTDEERAFLGSVAPHAESGYAHLQATRPDTLAAALIDSPSGLLAWIAEKVAAWSDGEGLERIDPDDLLLNVAVYWFTRSIGTSFRPYAEGGATDGPHPLITVPASILIQRHEAAYPRSLAEKSYTDIRTFDRLEAGGHFAAWEAPERVAAAILALEAEVR
jgi:pimeloyl-ACP methyl ester carboxylesterase